MTIPAGEREASIELPTLQDGKYEVDETFVVRLSDPQGAEFGFVRTATVSIQDDDVADPTLVDDFETTPWLFDTTGKSTLTTREVAADSGDGYEGQDAYENVADFAYKGKSTLGREFAMVDLFRRPTISSFAAFLTDGVEPGWSRAAIAARAERQRNASREHQGWRAKDR